MAAWSCERTRRHLKAWLDGELSGGKACRLEAHLEACGACRGWSDDFEEMGRALREALERSVRFVPDPPVGAVLASLGRRSRLEERTVRVLQRVAAVAAAVLILTVAFEGLWPRSERPVATADEVLATFLEARETVQEFQLDGGF